MKTEKTRCHNSELHDYVNDKAKEIEQQSIINAENYAVRNKPSLFNRRIHAYFHEDHIKFQAVIDTVGVKIPLKAICDEVAEHDKLTQSQLQAVHNKLIAAKERQIGIDARLKNKKQPFSKHRLPLVWLGVAIIALFEGLLALPVFETWGYGLAEALCMSVLFAGAIAVFAHLFEKILLLGKTVWQRRGVALALLLLLILLFWYMADIRAQYLSKEAANSTGAVSVHFSPIPFVCTSVLLFVIAVGVCYFFLPTGEQRNAMREYKALQLEKQHNEAEQLLLVQSMEAKQLEHAELRQLNASMLNDGCGLEQFIVSRAHGCFALWKKHHMMHRPDNGRPLSFDSEEYPFTFITNFHAIKLL